MGSVLKPLEFKTVLELCQWMEAEARKSEMYKDSEILNEAHPSKPTHEHKSHPAVEQTGKLNCCRNVKSVSAYLKGLEKALK